MWPPDRIPRCCGRSIHTWCLFTSHLCYPSWACCRWIHAWHPAMPMFFFADSVREVLITQSLLQGGATCFQTCRIVKGKCYGIKAISICEISLIGKKKYNVTFAGKHLYFFCRLFGRDFFFFASYLKQREP